ncbi:MAG: 4'-phosphopantetheinyl transferase superfamily protein [Bacteroides sp.]|nr:4'-phosphopantetheinyl transferase superfamily protein [Bacteroides sp.]MCM1447566.1 4'-phosphopantetheinyl transferase superfamily protein [Bacteroides sp.]
MKFLIQDNLSEYSADALEQCLQNLPGWRRDQAMRYAGLEGRRNCILAYLLLCRALEEEYGINDRPTFIIGEHGKPALAEYPHIHFNISHCHTAILCAVSHQPVGVDIESTGRKTSDALIRYTMNEEEQKLIKLSTEHTFLRLWTMKEALVKLWGKGLHGSIADLLLPTNTTNITFTTEENVDRGYVFSIAQYDTSL